MYMLTHTYVCMYVCICLHTPMYVCKSIQLRLSIEMYVAYMNVAEMVCNFFTV